MATENGRDLLWKPTNVKESTVKFWRDSGDSCLVNWVQGLVSVFPLVDMENPLSLNPLLCEAFSLSWLRFSLFSLTSINTLVTFQVFPTLRSGLTASRLLIQHHACFFFLLFIPSAWEISETKREWRSSLRREFLGCSTDLYLMLF